MRGIRQKIISDYLDLNHLCRRTVYMGEKNFINETCDHRGPKGILRGVAFHAAETVEARIRRSQCCYRTTDNPFSRLVRHDVEEVLKIGYR